MTFYLKPFNLKEAKAGKPVCTRDGRRARIICFDKKGGLPIVALIEKRVNDRVSEEVASFNINGCAFSDNVDLKIDLMMLSEKRSGWVNVYKHNLYDTESEAKRAHVKEGYIDTIKIEWEE